MLSTFFLSVLLVVPHSQYLVTYLFNKGPHVHSDIQHDTDIGVTSGDVLASKLFFLPFIIISDTVLLLCSPM